ncbi:endonuclease/exonuclease/phosphatase family protein [soil metagenome]
MNFTKKLVWRLFKATTILLLLIYIPASFVYIISPQQWWLMGIFSVGFPYLWIFLMAYVFAWFFYQKRTSFLLLALLLAGLPVMKNVFAIQPVKAFTVVKQTGHFRIMQWNCNGLPPCIPVNESFCQERAKAVAFIKKYNPDIICVQDFAEVIANSVSSNIALMQDTLGYRYFRYRQHYNNKVPGWQDGIGIAIFSKFPIENSGLLNYPKKKKPESILWAGFNINGKPFRVATTHLQSMHLSRDLSKPLEKDLSEDSVVIMQANKIEKLKYFQPYHVTEARYLRQFLDTCKSPLIFTGDLNSVPASYVYHTVRGKLNDAFLQNNAGFGRTYDSWQPTLRIDYIFYNDAIQSHQTSLFRTTFSDHDPLIMDFTIR